MAAAVLVCTITSAGAAEPVELLANPARPIVHESGAGVDVAFSLELRNRGEARYRVTGWWLRWRTAQGLLPATALEPLAALHPAPRSLEPQRLAVWRGLCLAVPEGAEAVSVEVELRRRRTRRVDRLSHTVAFERRRATVALRLPFTGAWKVTQGHECGSAHRTAGFGGEFAWDFAALPQEPGEEDPTSFGAPVLAPVTGRVLMVENDMPDHDRSAPLAPPLLETLVSPQHMFGNFVVLDAGGNNYVLLGHLMQGSVEVEPGERVVEGQAIARCGNSGYTREPHVHVQVMDRPDAADPHVRGLPAVFRDYMEIVPLGRAGDRSDLWIRRVETGDPQRGTVVSSR